MVKLVNSLFINLIGSSLLFWFLARLNAQFANHVSTDWLFTFLFSYGVVLFISVYFFNYIKPLNSIVFTAITFIFAYLNILYIQNPQTCNFFPLFEKRYGLVHTILAIALVLSIVLTYKRIPKKQEFVSILLVAIGHAIVFVYLVILSPVYLLEQGYYRIKDFLSFALI